MTASPSPDGHAFLRAATAGIRHHTRGLTTGRDIDRVHLDTLHAHLTELHRLLDQLAHTARPPHPGAGRLLATAHARTWEASVAVHHAFHLLPTPAASTTECRPDRLPDDPQILTICQRHTAAGHSIRRKTTPTDLAGPRTTACVR
ncbi:DUF6238 family protein [Streptomyces sp. GZWMJZ-114]|uniref:DUF6238 family protein n=1 Tax=Streptomyces sp. GZWMJZ-114 TaxID=2494734 RepID=UPI0010137A88|nr:DUF6238 family protein [Streptomyces sp. GZWMJZ-114]